MSKPMYPLYDKCHVKTEHDLTPIAFVITETRKLLNQLNCSEDRIEVQGTSCGSQNDRDSQIKQTAFVVTNEWKEVIDALKEGIPKNYSWRRPQIQGNWMG